MVVLTPESGDDVQTMKSGLLEIADVIVVTGGDFAGLNASLQPPPTPNAAGGGTTPTDPPTTPTTSAYGEVPTEDPSQEC